MLLNAGRVCRLAIRAVFATALAFVLVACHRDAAKPAALVVGHQDAKAALPSAPALPVEPVAPRGKQLTIVYSSNLLGEYEPCG